ncbi:gamma-synuclein isoform X1 [Hemicordylus capensis]|uniref:gamma-synuclein isoform X1 n=1 Tax=Hemicordylus capensis TaxID=884348 RepID=UPI0023028991|nr:gamma-synuclein isoform X1 [Hemicordylus capensis]
MRKQDEQDLLTQEGRKREREGGGRGRVSGGERKREKEGRARDRPKPVSGLRGMSYQGCSSKKGPSQPILLFGATKDIGRGRQARDGLLLRLLWGGAGVGLRRIYRTQSSLKSQLLLLQTKMPQWKPQKSVQRVKMKEINPPRVF